MTGKILRISYLVAISALLASVLLFFGVMYRDYEDGAFARLRAEAAAIAQGLGAVGSDYFDSFAPDDRVTWIAANGTVLYDSAAPAQLWKATRDAKRSTRRCKPARRRPRAIPRRFCSARFIMQSFWRAAPSCAFRARRIRSLR